LIDFDQLLDITGAIPGEKFTFTCDASEAGWGEAKFDLVHRGRSLPHTVREVEKGIYMITFTPQERGKHRVYVYYNGIEVKGIIIRSCKSSASLSLLAFQIYSRAKPPALTNLAERFEMS
jgi:hypothetical protein